MNHACDVSCSPMESCIKASSASIQDVPLLVGGLPCQSFSTAGKRMGVDDPRGEVFFDFVYALRALNPRMFLVENVKGILSHENGNTFRMLCRQLSVEGKYNVYHSILNAADYGVPQNRERVFVVGVRSEVQARFVFPEGYGNRVTVGTALESVPYSRGVQYSEYKRSYFKKIPQGGCWIHIDLEDQKKYMGSSFYASGGRRGILRRLSMDKVSPTLLCNPQSKQSERCHPTEDRPLTIREYARIQTFDDDYEFVGSMAQQYKQIGNAVPVQLAICIGKAIIDYQKTHFLPILR